MFVGMCVIVIVPVVPLRPIQSPAVTESVLAGPEELPTTKKSFQYKPESACTSVKPLAGVVCLLNAIFGVIVGCSGIT